MPSDLKDTSTLPPRTTSVRLAAGQSLRLRMAAGTVMHASAGALELAGPPQWLADTCHVPQRRLLAGDTWIAPESGWLTVTASHAGALSVTVQPGPAGHLQAWLALLLRRGRLASQAGSCPIPDPAPEKL
jgi:hypothetical protein